MRTAHVVETLEIGGAETLVALLSRYQRTQGHTVSIHCIYSGGKLASGLAADGFPIDIAPAGSRWTKLGHLKRSFSELGVEVAHFHNATATIYGAPAAKAAGVRTILSTRHGLVAPPYGISREVQYSLVSRTCCDFVVGVCQATTNNLRGAPLADRGRIVTVYNGATPAIRSESQDLPPKKGTIFVTVGRLAPPKDHLALIEAMAVARNRNNDICLWVVGDGVLRQTLAERASQLKLGDSVLFLGSQSNVGDYLAASDVFVLSSRSEGLPVSQLEAMAAGLPSVVSNVGAMPELVTGGDCGVIVPPGDIQSLAEALLQCASDSDLRARLGANAREHYLKNFTLEMMAENYQRLYQRQSIP